MATSFTKDKGEAAEIIEALISRHHPELEEAEVSIGVLWAWPGEDDEDGAVLKLHGYQAAAIIKINKASDRLQGMPDATIKIDAKLWRDRLDDFGRIALIDHELTHLVVLRDKDNHIKSDDAGRPKLKMRLHDVQIGVFDSIIRRYADKSLDGQHVKIVVDAYGQAAWDWDSVPDGAAELAGAMV